MDATRLASELGAWTTASGPLYQRLAGELRAVVRRGALGVGSKLPSERDLAQALDISRTTVISAYRLLREEGLLEASRGSGTRVTPTGRGVGPAVPTADIPATKLLDDPSDAATDMLDLTASTAPDLDPLPAQLHELTAATIRELAGECGYQPLGLPTLRAALADRYTRLGLPTTTPQILITTGGQQAISLLFALFADRHGAIITENPTYAGALDAARTTATTLIALPTDDDGIKPRSLRQALRDSDIRLIYLMTGCHNPTGAAMSTTRQHQVAHLAATTATPIIDDTTLADLSFTDQPHYMLASNGATVITIGSLSKLCWPGLRVGWIRAPEPLITRLARLKLVADLGSAQPSQILATHLVPALDQIAATRRHQLQQRLHTLTDHLRTHLPDWAWTPPQGGPFLWTRIPHGNATAFSQLALRHRVRILPGDRTTPDGTCSDRLRLSYVAHPNELRTAVERLTHAWFNYERAHTTRVPLEIVV